LIQENNKNWYAYEHLLTAVSALTLDQNTGPIFSAVQQKLLDHKANWEASPEYQGALRQIDNKLFGGIMMAYLAPVAAASGGVIGFTGALSVTDQSSSLLRNSFTGGDSRISDDITGWNYSSTVIDGAAVTTSLYGLGRFGVTKINSWYPRPTIAEESNIVAPLTRAEVRAKIFGTAQQTGNDGAHAFRSYREAILLARSPEVEAVFLNRGYNRGLDLAPNTIRPNRRPDVLGRYFDGRVDRVEVPSGSDVDDLLIQRNRFLDPQIRAQGFDPLYPRIARIIRKGP
jgi:hypothetical protein